MPITKQVNPQANVKQRTDSDDLSGSSASVASSGINYDLNPGFESDTSGYATYADAAAATPVDGTGGSPNVTLSRSTSSPLRGVASGLFTKDAANRQGQGWSYDFTIDDADRAKILSVQFDYIINSGSFNAGSPSADSDIEMWIYDKTNAVLIPVTPFKLVSNSSVTPETFKGIFQSASNSTSYRLIWHVATTNASAWSFKIDNVSVGPQIVLNAPNIGDWAFYTPTTQGFGTTSGMVAKYRIVGDSVEINVVFVTGTVTATQARVSLPPGMVADPSKVTGLEFVGTGAAGNNGDAYYTVLCNGGYTYVTFGIQQSTRNSLTEYNGTDIVGSTTSFALQATIPISGLSSNTVTGSDADARPVVAVYSRQGAGNTTPGSGNPINFPNMSIDTHAAVTTGASWKFTAPVSGFYYAGITQNGNTTGTIFLYQNGVQNGNVICHGDSAGDSGAIVVPLKAGEYIDFRDNSGATYNSGTISIFKISGMVLPLAAETIACRYRQASAQTVIQGNLTSTNIKVINFDTKDYDTHGAVSPGASWVFTAPRSDWYQVDVNVSLHFTNNGSSPFTMLARLIKNPNGSPVEMSTKSLGLPVITGGNAWERSIGDKIFLLAGEQLQVTVAHNSDAGGTVATSTSGNWFGVDTNNIITISTKG